MRKKINTCGAESSVKYAVNRRLFVCIIPGLILSFLLSASHAEIYQVKRAIDGDTLLLINGEKVRLIGVDTPETKRPRKPVEYFGIEAYKFTKQMAEGKVVKLEYDWQRRDRYRRLLAYVYLMDGTLLNAEIIKQGCGFAYTRYPFQYMGEFRLYQREAREKKRGLWKKEVDGA